MGRGIEVHAGAKARLRLLSASGARSADTLEALLCAGQRLPDGAGPNTAGDALIWRRTSSGPSAIIAVGNSRSVGALVTAFTAAGLAARARSGTDVDDRGALNPPDDLQPFWDEHDSTVDVYNCEVTTVVDLTDIVRQLLG